MSWPDDATLVERAKRSTRADSESTRTEVVSVNHYSFHSHIGAWPANGPSSARLRGTDHAPGPGRLRRLSLLLMAADGLVVMLAFGVAVPWHLGIGPARTDVLLVLLLAAVLMVGALHGAGAYAPRAHEQVRAQFERVFLSGSAIFALLVVLRYACRDPLLFSNASIMIWYIGSLAGLGVLRHAAYKIVCGWRRSGLLARVVAVVDVDGMGHLMADRMCSDDGRDLHLLNVYSLHGDGHNDIDALVRIARTIKVDDVVVAAPCEAMAKVNAAIARLSALPTNVHICTNLLDARYPFSPSTLLFGHPVCTVHHCPLDGWAFAIKRTEDLILGTILLALLLPLMGAIALAIKLDSPGPVLFRQKRLGLGNSVFEILKFRSMTHRPEPEQDVTQATRNDPRVTRVGRFLRRSSLDELPQLINVLKGEMSLVGPRPHALSHNEQFSAAIGNYWGRHRVRPGITGWAQVHGCRGATEVVDKIQRRVDYDLEYIENWSLLLDLRVLFATVVVCLLGWESY